MKTVLQLVETLRAEEANARRLYEGDGMSLGAKRKNHEFLKKLVATAQLVERAQKGSRLARFTLSEAMTTSDFPIVFGGLMDRVLLGGYRETPASWPKFVKKRTVKDFREVKSITLDGGQAVLEKVKERGEYPEVSLAENEYGYSVSKYGRRLSLDWEMLINDDIEAFNDVPRRFGVAARRTEDKFVTNLFVDANGPHAGFFTGGNDNIVTGNPVLSITGLQAAMTQISNQVDDEGEPIIFEKYVLVIPPALETTARNIVNATEIRLTANGGVSGQELVGPNWARDIVDIAVAHYIPPIAKTANGNTSWFLFGDPRVANRPALEVGFLQGHEEPEVFMRKSDQVRVSGADAGEEEGSFENDSVDYKIRHVLGGTRLDPRSAVASNGSGS
jgi:hypothetical protein